MISWRRTRPGKRSTFGVLPRITHFEASQEVRSAIVYATIIIVLVFVPLFALSGIEGRLFAPLGQAYIIAILASLVVSVTLTPVMAYFMLPGLKKLDQRESGIVPILKRLNARLLSFAFDRQAAVLTAAMLIIALALVALYALPRSFLPGFNEGTFTVNLSFNPGISLAESNRVGAIAESNAAP